MTNPYNDMAQRLRGTCDSIRRNSVPMRDLIGMLQQAADLLDGDMGSSPRISDPTGGWNASAWHFTVISGPNSHVKVEYQGLPGVVGQIRVYDNTFGITNVIGGKTTGPSSVNAPAKTSGPARWGPSTGPLLDTRPEATTLSFEEPQPASEPTYLVVWSLKTTDPTKLFDVWTTCGSMEEAQAKYDEVRKDEMVYAVSICAVVKSTDYDPHPAFKAYTGEGSKPATGSRFGPAKLDPAMEIDATRPKFESTTVPVMVDTVYVVTWDGPSSGGHNWFYAEDPARADYSSKSLDPDYRYDQVRLLEVRLDPPKYKADTGGIESVLRSHDLSGFPLGTHITLLVERTADKTEPHLTPLNDRFMPGERTTFQRLAEGEWFRTTSIMMPLRKTGPMMRPDTPVQRMTPNKPVRQPAPANEYARAVAMLSMHMLDGYREEGVKDPSRCSEMQAQGGWISVTQRLAELAMQFQDWIATWIGDGRDYPGVFEYEVVESMGRWFYSHSMCMADEFMAEARKQTEAFFNQK